jgi:hypothetical protein
VETPARFATSLRFIWLAASEKPLIRTAYRNGLGLRIKGLLFNPSASLPDGPGSVRSRLGRVLYILPSRARWSVESYRTPLLRHRRLPLRLLSETWPTCRPGSTRCRSNRA